MSFRGNGARKWIVLATYLLVVAIYTWPAARHFNTHLLGIGYDNYALAWILWWWKYALAHGHDPFFTRLIFSPHGLNLMGVNLMPLMGILSIPIQAVVGFPSTYNILLIASIVAGALLMYIVALRAGGDPQAAVLAGFIFGFAPVIMVRAAVHLNLAASFPIPLTILAMSRIKGSALERWPVKGLLLGAAMAVGAYVDLQTAFYLLPMLTLWFLREFISSSARGRLQLIFAGGLSVLLFAALYFPFLVRLFPFPIRVWPGSEGADLAAFVTPSSLSPFFHSLVSQAYEHVLSGGWIEGMCYLGWTALALATYGVVKGYRANAHVRWWVWITALYLLLACGDNLRIWGHAVSIGPFPVLLPMHFLRGLPVLSSIYEPTRLVRLAIPGVAMLAAFGYQELRKRFEGRKARVAWVCSALIFLDFLTAPFPLAPGDLPAVYQRIRSESAQGGTFYLPLNADAQTAEWAMARMDTPLPSLNFYIGTHFSTNDWIAIRQYYYEPVIRAVTIWQGGVSLPGYVAEGVRPQTPAFLRKYQIRRIVVLSEAATPELLNGLRTVLGTPGEAIGRDYLFETGSIAEIPPAPLQGEEASIIAETNLLLAYETRDDLQREFPGAAHGNVCALYQWAASGAREEPSLAPYAAIFRARAAGGECNQAGTPNR